MMLSETSFGEDSCRIETKELISKKSKCKYYNKLMTTRENGNFQFHNKEESKLNSTINANSGAHTLTHDKIIKKFIQWEKRSNY